MASATNRTEVSYQYHRLIYEGTYADISMVRSKVIDEEQPYEVSLTGDVTTSDEGSPVATRQYAQIIPKPKLGDRRLTEVSQKYDRNGKGYLDDTELALRRLDTQGNGFLDIDKVYIIMESLQKEQKNSAELIGAIRKEHKRNMSLKRGVIVLGGFSVLLAISNIGTSFAAARLAQNMKVSSASFDLVAMDGERLGTTSKEVEFSMTPVQEDLTDERRRHLETISSFVCGAENAAGKKSCSLKGAITFTQAMQMYRQFCPMWPNQDNTCQGDGVAKINLNCNGVPSTVFGGNKIPPTGPTVDTFGYEYMIFPTQSASYQAQQALYNSAAGAMQKPCMQDFQIGFYCETSGSECFIIASVDTEQCPGLVSELCGPVDP
jgi:hypothetical protein